MKKRDLAAFAMIITSAALLVGACQQSPTSGGTAPVNAPANSLSPAQTSFFNSLSPEAKSKFTDLDAKRKQAAMDQAASGTDANQAVKDQYDQQKSDKSRPPVAPGSAPTPPGKKNGM